MGYVDTLFGHQDHVVSLDALRAETAVSSGARDRTVRFWKVVDENQLVFRGGGKSKLRDVLEGGLEGLDDSNENEHKSQKTGGLEGQYEEGRIDCVAMIDESTFVSGGDSGYVSLCLGTVYVVLRFGLQYHSDLDNSQEKARVYSTFSSRAT